MREWLSGMATAGYVTFDPANEKFELPKDFSPVLAQEGGAFFFGGMLETLPEMAAVLDEVVESFKTGGGVHQSHYSDRFYAAGARSVAARDENFLVHVWIPMVAGLQPRLEEGVAVADVGCGGGGALVRLAEAFPKSRFVGYDIHPPNIDKAKALAEEAGVSDRVDFQVRDVSGGLDESYDLITTFDVIHDAADPRGLLSVIRKALNPAGSYLCFEFQYAENLKDNIGPWGTMLYGFSLFYCLTTSLAQGGEGLGTLGLPDSKFRELVAEAGFGSVEEVVLGDPVNRLYHVRI